MGYIVKDKDAPANCHLCYNSGCVHWETNSYEKFEDCPIIPISDEDCGLIKMLISNGDTVKGAMSIIICASLLRSISPEFRQDVENVDISLLRRILGDMQNNVNINLEAEETK